MADHEPIQDLWLSQKKEQFSMSTDDIRQRASRLHATVSARNMREYVVGAALIVVFGAFAVLAKTDLSRAALFLSAAGVAVTLWQLFRHARSAATSEVYLVTQWIDFYRAELVRQRDALRSVWVWYLGPLIPGLVLFWISAGEKQFLAGNHIWAVVTSLGGITVAAAFFYWVAAANRKAASQLQAEIDSLDRLNNE
jgi:hypothetical protein